jgi:DNA-binding MarR family transcriptional regulator
MLEDMAATQETGLGSDLVIYAARLVRTVRRQFDLPAGARILSILDEVGAAGISQLAQLDNCSQPTMSAAVASLTDLGLVTKTPHPNDARSSVVELTETGREELYTLRARFAEAITQRLEERGHTPEELATTVAILRDIVDPAE